MRVMLCMLLATAPWTAAAQVTNISVYASSGKTHETRHGQADVRAVNIEFGRALSRRTEVAFVLAPMSLWQPRSWFGDQFGDGNETVRAISGSLLIRRTLNSDSSRLHFYGEASTGPMWAEKAVPASTSRFNFMTQFGAGVVLMPKARFPLMAGYRFAHASNGGYSPRNPGVNISSVVLGVRWKR